MTNKKQFVMTDKEYRQAKAWIEKKTNSGVTKEQLRVCVGIFSNRKKESVKAQKSLNEKQYKERRHFLANVFYLLD